MKQESIIVNNAQEHVAEISDDIEIVSPGRMLKEAREMRGLSQQQVADKLNFRKTLVEEIELDQFDLTVPEAFNRGYLKNYAKLVNVAHEDVLNSYDQLGVAKRQYAEMQSFSKGTEKQAEHNMVMWITYLILATLVIATVVWWGQRPSEQPEPIIVETLAVESKVNKAIEHANLLAENKPNSEAITHNPEQQVTDVIASVDAISASLPVLNDVSSETANKLNNAEASAVEQVPANLDLNNSAVDTIGQQAHSDEDLITTLVNVVFTFSGDCWVNISDATGERIAWGVKKSGYIMRISGQAPFSITLGRPELVQIDYNDQSVDMSAFNAGNIAKFSLPLVP
jgi:cytoskeleton protein RodZ